MDGAWQKEASREQIAEFLRMLAVCHTVLPEGGETPASIKYQVKDQPVILVTSNAYYNKSPCTPFVLLKKGTTKTLSSAPLLHVWYAR